MKFLLIAIAVLGLIYVVFINSKKSDDKPDRPEALYQKEVEKVKAVEILLQDTVDQRLNEMDQAR
jgi:hypothetical protein